jgi:hypothetical protein
VNYLWSRYLHIPADRVEAVVDELPLSFVEYMTENLLEDLADHAKWLSGGGEEEVVVGPVVEVPPAVIDDVVVG